MYRTPEMFKQMQAYTGNIAGRVGAHVEIVHRNGRTPLYDAARFSSPDTSCEVTYNGTDVDAVDKNGRIPLHDAVRAGSRTAIHQLINKGATDEVGLPLLVTVILPGQKKDDRLLLNRGVYPGKEHEYETTNTMVEEMFVTDGVKLPEITKIYETLPLNSTIEQIRTATIQPGFGNKPVTLTLKRSILLQPGIKANYTALSYMWGYKTRSFLPLKLWDESKPEIWCEGPSHKVSHIVTPNLYAALRQLRHSTNPKTFWIDAICINQMDDQEKTDQVKLMGKIYTRAEKTLVWLGQENYTSSWGFKAIRFLSTIMLDALNSQHNIKEEAQQEQPQQEPSDFFQSQATNWKFVWYSCAIIWLLQNPYFTRVWIIQEIALSQDIDFQLGSECVPMKQFEAAVATISTTDFGTKNTRTLSHISAIRSIVRGYTKAGSKDLSPRLRQILEERLDLDGSIFSIISLFRGSNATHKVDKIFGLLGLCREFENAQTLGIEENYKLNERDAYIRPAVAILKAKQNLGLFAALSLQSGGESIAELPSWVPDVRISFCIQFPHEAFTYLENIQWSNTKHVAIPIYTRSCDFAATRDSKFHYDAENGL
jgi:hypothetical protein